MMPRYVLTKQACEETGNMEEGECTLAPVSSPSPSPRSSGRWSLRTAESLGEAMFIGTMGTAASSSSTALGACQVALAEVEVVRIDTRERLCGHDDLHPGSETAAGDRQTNEELDAQSVKLRKNLEQHDEQVSCQAVAETVVAKAEHLCERVHLDPNLPASVGASFEEDTLEAETAKLRISLSEALQQESLLRECVQDYKRRWEDTSGEYEETKHALDSLRLKVMYQLDTREVLFAEICDRERWLAHFSEGELAIARHRDLLASELASMQSVLSQQSEHFNAARAAQEHTLLCRGVLENSLRMALEQEQYACYEAREELSRVRLQMNSRSGATRGEVSAARRALEHEAALVGELRDTAALQAACIEEHEAYKHTEHSGALRFSAGQPCMTTCRDRFCRPATFPRQCSAIWGSWPWFT